MDYSSSYLGDGNFHYFYEKINKSIAHKFILMKEMAKPSKKRGAASSKSKKYTDKIIELEIELSKINREKSVFVLNKAITLYIIFMVVAVVGMLNGYKSFFNILIVMGFCVLIIGALPYIRTMYSEEKKLKDLMEKLKK